MATLLHVLMIIDFCKIMKRLLHYTIFAVASFVLAMGLFFCYAYVVEMMSLKQLLVESRNARIVLFSIIMLCILEAVPVVHLLYLNKIIKKPRY